MPGGYTVCAAGREHFAAVRMFIGGRRNLRLQLNVFGT